MKAFLVTYESFVCPTFYAWPAGLAVIT